MISNFIGGGQVFLHKVRMLRLVIGALIFANIYIVKKLYYNNIYIIN